MKVSSADEASLVEAGILLSRGRLVAFPTETVFGLGCDASSEDAVERLYRVKGRARGNPLIVHVSSMEEAERWGVLCGRARLLARRFWAGGLTLVVPYRGEGFAPRGVVTDMGSIALRVPSHGLRCRCCVRLAEGLRRRARIVRVVFCEVAAGEAQQFRPRARGNPLIVHVSSMEEAERWGVLCGRARLLARRFLGWRVDFSCSVSRRGVCSSRRCDGYGEYCVACSFAWGCVVVVACVWRRRQSGGECCVVALGCLRVVFGLAG